MKSRKTSILTIATQKGGVGKTTSTVNLASAFAIMGKKVLVVDVDIQANATSYLGVVESAKKSRKYIYDAISSESGEIENYILKTKFKNIDCLAADSRLKNINKEFHGQPQQFKLLHNLFNSPTLSNYDLLLVDTHPSFDCLSQSALSASDYYIIPVFPEAHCIQGLGDQIQSANTITKYENKMLTFLGCIITKNKASSTTHQKFEPLLRDLAENCKFSVFTTMIPTSDAIASSASNNTPIHFFRPDLPVATAYSSLAGELAPMLKGKRRGRRFAMPDETAIKNTVQTNKLFDLEDISF